MFKCSTIHQVCRGSLALYFVKTNWKSFSIQPAKRSEGIEKQKQKQQTQWWWEIYLNWTKRKIEKIVVCNWIFEFD